MILRQANGREVEDLFTFFSVGTLYNIEIRVEVDRFGFEKNRVAISVEDLYKMVKCKR